MKTLFMVGALALIPLFSQANDNPLPEGLQPLLEVSGKDINAPFAVGQILKRIELGYGIVSFHIIDNSFGVMNDAQIEKARDYLQASSKFLFCGKPGFKDAINQGWKAQYSYTNYNEKLMFEPIIVDTCVTSPSDAGVLADHMVTMLNEMEPVQIGPIKMHGGDINGKSISIYATLYRPFEELNDVEIDQLTEYASGLSQNHEAVNCADPSTEAMIHRGYTITLALKSYEGATLESFTAKDCPLR